jgi:AcrR family transcriptional regulator
VVTPAVVPHPDEPSGLAFDCELAFISFLLFRLGCDDWAMSGEPNRGPRRDAVRNRELLLDSAQRLFRERGAKVSSLAITEGAGLGAGTLYRHFPTREDLLAALSERSYRIALQHAAEAAASDRPTADALRRFLERTIERRDELALPLHGGPVTLDDTAVELRTQISATLDRVLARGREQGEIRADVTSTDIILIGALLAQPLPGAPDWDTVARRQAAIYIEGLHPTDGPALPGRGLSRADLERAFKRTPRRARAGR